MSRCEWQYANVCVQCEGLAQLDLFCRFSIETDDVHNVLVRTAAQEEQQRPRQPFVLATDPTTEPASAPEKAPTPALALPPIKDPATNTVDRRYAHIHAHAHVDMHITNLQLNSVAAASRNPITEFRKRLNTAAKTTTLQPSTPWVR